MQEREIEKTALIGHRVTKRAAPGVIPPSGASTETSVAHFCRPKHPSRATLTGREVEYCRSRVPHAPTVFQKTIIKNDGQLPVNPCV